MLQQMCKQNCMLGTASSPSVTVSPPCNAYAWSPSTTMCYLFNVNMATEATVASPMTDYQYYTVQCIYIYV